MTTDSEGRMAQLSTDDSAEDESLTDQVSGELAELDLKDELELEEEDVALIFALGLC